MTTTGNYWSSSTISGDIWVQDASGARYLVGNYPRPRARVPRELKAMLTDPRVVYLSEAPVWAKETYLDGQRSDEFVLRADSLMTVGMASDVETGEIQFWASGRRSRSSYWIMPMAIDEGPVVMTSTPPRGLVQLEVKRRSNERQRPYTVTSTSISYSDSWW